MTIIIRILILSVSLLHLSNVTANQIHAPTSINEDLKDTIFKKNGKYGALNSKGKVGLPFNFDALYAVVKSEIAWHDPNGFIGLRSGTWSYFSTTYELIKERLDFDNWVGNSGAKFPYVIKDSKVMFFNTDSLASMNLHEFRDDFGGFRTPQVFQNESSRLWGSFDSYGSLRCAFEKEQLFAVNQNFYEFGYVAQENGQWKFYNRFFKLQQEHLPFDQWLANSGMTHCFVIKNDTVYQFSPETYEISGLDFNADQLKMTNRLQRRSSNLITLQDERSMLYGAINSTGETMIPFRYKVIFIGSDGDKTPILAKKNSTSGDFYTADGNFILTDKRSPYFLGMDQSYVQVQQGTENFAPRALFKLDIASKRLNKLTEFKLWWFNIAPYGKSEFVATATYKNGKNVYITSDGQEIEIER
ncbi:MAG: hypothetical protein ACI9XB_004577 [Gammaproteobacteria bacterium]|jgi:hypothetical protein